MGTARSFDSANLLAHAGWVRSLARSLLPLDVHQADDVAQDACLAALEHRPESDRPLAGWMTTVVKNLVRENRRRARHRDAREQASARIEATPSTSDVVEQLSVHREVVEFVTELDEPYTTTILLRYFEELSPRAIARRQGVPLATVKTRLARALEKLREKLDRRHGNDGKAWLAALIPLTHSQGGVPATIAVASIMSAQLKVALTMAALLCGVWLLWPTNVKSATQDATLTAAQEPRDAIAEPRADPSASLVRSAEARGDQRVALDAAHPRVDAPAIVAQKRLLHGRVVDEHARAVSGVSVSLSLGRNNVSAREFNVPTPKPAADAPSATSDGSGQFELPVPTVSGVLLAFDDRWTTVLSGLCGPESGAAECVVVVAPHLAHRGRVIDDAGRALAKVRLAIELPRDFRLAFPQVLDNSAERGWYAESDELGHFELGDAPRLDGATLHASLEGFVPLAQPAPTISEGALELVLRHPEAKPGMVNGQVVDEHGNSVAEARVSLGSMTTTLTDSNGAFALELPKQGARNTWMAVKRGHQPAIVTASAAVQSGEAHENEFVLLRLGPAPLSISGRVLDADDRPQAGFKVFLADPTFFAQYDEVPAHIEGLLAGAAARAEIEKLMATAPQDTDPEEMLKDTSTVFWTFVKTDARGQFELEGLLARTYRLAAMDPTTLLRVESDPIQAGRSDAEIRIPRGVYLENVRGTVVTRGGEPITGVVVTPMTDVLTVQLGAGSWSTFNVGSKAVLTDEKGQFEFAHLPRKDAYLQFGGEDILPFDFGRKVTGGIEAAAKGEVGKIVIEAALRYHLQVQIDAETADEARVLDADGQELMINVFEGNSSTSTNEVKIIDGRSKVLVVGDDARTLVVYKARQEVRRAPLSLVRSRVNIVQL